MHNTNATTPIPFTLTVADRSGGATARSGGAKHGKDDNARKLRNKVIQRVPELLKATGNIPG